MAIRSRKVKNKRDENGMLTDKPGNVYDVNIKYMELNGTKKTYAKKGFRTKAEARAHETTMKNKLINPTFTPVLSSNGKQSLKEYLTNWIEIHGKANLRDSTIAGYKSIIDNHLIPNIGHIKLNQLTPEMIDQLYQGLFAKGLSNNTVRYVQRVLNVSLEHAQKYHSIERNPAMDTITKIGKGNKTPDPYTVDQMKLLMEKIEDTRWEMFVVLGGLYGLRISEIIGLRLPSIDINPGMGVFAVIEQLPFNLPSDAKIITRMEPPKSQNRILPITETSRPFFERQFARIAEQREALLKSGEPYYENNLFVARPNGEPYRRSNISSGWKSLLESLDLPHIRFHDLRHTAATNMHALTGDFYTVGEILGHSLKGMGIELSMKTNFDAVTAQYIAVGLDRKKIVLDTYHKAVDQKGVKTEVDKTAKTPKKSKGDLEL